MNPEKSKGSYIPALDGFRGLAGILVVTFHTFGFIEKYLFFSQFALDMFFVLSGYLITDILLKTLKEKHSLRNFYMRRILRVFPLYYLSLIIFLIIFPNLKIELGLEYYADNQVWMWTYMQNWLFIFKTPDSSTLIHLWSLAIEEHFYLLWPLIVLLIRKPRNLILFLLLIMIILTGLRIWVWSKQIPGFAYFNLFSFTRIDSICVGCMLAIVLRHYGFFIKKYILSIVLFLVTINLLFLFINQQFQNSLPYLAFVGYTTIAVVLGLLLNQIIVGKTKLINSIFNFSWLRFLGKVSYGFYIFHWPVHLLLSPYLLLWFGSFTSEWQTQFIVSTLTTVASVVVGWLSFKFYESYFLKLKDKFS